MAEEGPAWTQDQLALLADARLTGDARVVGLLLSHAGEQGLSYIDLEELLPDASRDRLRVAAQKLERCKWADRLIGGRGHGDRFVYIACPSGATYRENRVAIFGMLKHRMPATGTLSAISVPASPMLKASSSSSTAPPPPPLDARAREFIRSTESLKGLRGSLLDYLETGRAGDGDRQLAYAQSVAGIIEGTDEATWMQPDGSHVRDGRAKIIAGVLNELRQGDEIGRYFTGAPGSIANLRAKIRYKVKSIAGVTRDATRQRNSNDPGAAAAAGTQPRARGHPAPDVRVER